MADPIHGKAPIVSLNSQDAEALESWIASTEATPHGKIGLSDTSADQDARAKKLKSLLGLLDQYPVPDAPADLTQRTLEHIATSKQRQRFADQVEAVSAPFPAFRWSELIAVAAVLMIGLSLLWPFLAQSRSASREVACVNALATAGRGFARYAGDHRGVLPRRGNSGKEWYHVGEPQADSRVRSNSAHLAVLVNGRYVHPNTLVCPDNEHAPRDLPFDLHDWPNAKAVSYSYQNQFTGKATRLDLIPRIAILADKNPFIVIVEGFKFDPDKDPSFHKGFGKGQNVLRLSGSVGWTTKPEIDGDDFYRVTGIDDEQYQGKEAPTSPEDSHLIP